GASQTPPCGGTPGAAAAPAPPSRTTARLGVGHERVHVTDDEPVVGLGQQQYQVLLERGVHDVVLIDVGGLTGDAHGDVHAHAVRALLPVAAHRTQPRVGAGRLPPVFSGHAAGVHDRLPEQRALPRGTGAPGVGVHEYRPTGSVGGQQLLRFESGVGDKPGELVVGV